MINLFLQRHLSDLSQIMTEIILCIHENVTIRYCLHMKQLSEISKQFSAGSSPV